VAIPVANLYLVAVPEFAVSALLLQTGQAQALYRLLSVALPADVKVVAAALTLEAKPLKAAMVPQQAPLSF